MAANVPSLALYFMPPAPKPPSGVPVVPFTFSSSKS